MYQSFRHHAALAALLVCATASALAAENTKDIVLDRISAPVATPAAAPASDAMVVSVLLESADGTLSPRGTDRMFRTGDRFRVKILASRDGGVALYNTNPRGVLSREPIWRGEVKVGQEIITPRLRLDGTSGVDQLHIVLEPTQDSGIFAWLGSWLRAPRDVAFKDISLDVQNTETATYLLSANGKGLVTTMRIVHR